MSDSHVRLLAAVARHREREKTEYDGSPNPSVSRQTDLAHSTVRARKQVSAARARRRLATGHERDE